MSIKRLLKEEIQKEIGILSKTEVGSEKYESAVDGIVKLTDRLIEMDKMENDKHDKDEARYNEREFKFAELEMESKDRLVKNCLTGTSIVGGLALTGIGTWVCLKFEEEGTITSLVGRGFINSLFRKK